MKVWIVLGWFGDTEWIEAVYGSEEKAEMAISELRKTRDSPNGPEYCRGLYKFGYEAYELK